MPKSIATMSPRRRHEQIALVHVGVEEALGNGLAQEGVDQPRGNGLEVVARRDQRLAVTHLDALDPVERHHPAIGAVPVDAGDDIAGDGGHGLGQLGGGGGLAAQIQLADGPALENSR